MGVMAAHLLLTLLLAGPAHLTPETPQGLEVRGHTSLRETPEPFKVVVSEGCVTSGSQQEGKELELQPGGSLVLTHRISLRPPSGPGVCGCQEELGRVLGRLEGLEREVSALRASCTAAGGCCSASTESKGAGCLVQPDPGARLCPGGCSDQGRCVGGACECFHGYSGTDCSSTPCPADCSDHGRCVDGGCECDPGYTGPDCSLGGCPGNCNDRGRCVNGECACSTGFTGSDCSEELCPSNCNNRGQCLNGKCVCDPEFMGPDCSKKSCPSNCNKRGQCLNGKCVCDPEFTGPDCSKKSCPSNCNKQGQCLNGKCACNPEFTGPDCSERLCPDNCNDRGRCVKGQCVCDPGFKGPDCSEKSCPSNCNARGRCTDGQCFCDPEFIGPDCSEKSCPDNCNARGRCTDGQCFCDPEFTGPDCSEKSCPDNCNARGRCTDGQCFCDPEFTGPDCSEKSCPDNCNARGRCTDGQCFCDPEFTGPDCSEKSCPSNCNARGRCTDGQCFCDPEFTGPDCSEKSCPSNCNKRGQCVNGRCVCDPKFTGTDCSERSCPGNCSGRGRCVAGRCVCDPGSTGAACGSRSCPAGCSGRGRCVEGRCVCRRAFSGPDCGLCAEGVTGPRCDQALSAVTGVMVDDITETSVTLLWTPPPVEYQTYHITFTSEKDSEQQIRAQVAGGAVRYAQTGLAAGQAYTATITGEIDGRAGAAHSVTFNTTPSGPTALRVVKTSTSSAVVQWEPAQGPIDGYLLTVSPNDGAGKAQEMALPPERDSAHIQHLEAGRLYDITLRAKSGAGQSAAAAAQVTPGETVPSGALVTVTMPPPPAPPRADGDRPLNPGPSTAGFSRPGQDSSSSATAGAQPPGRFPNGLKPKAGERGVLGAPRPGAPRPGAPLRPNGSRAGPGWRRAAAGPLRKTPGGAAMKDPTLVLKRRPGRPVGGEAAPETPRDHSGSGGDPRDTRDPRDHRSPGASSVSVANPSGEDGRTHSEETTVHPEVAVVTGGEQAGGGGPPEGSAPGVGAPTEEEEECLNKGGGGVGCGSPVGGETPPGGGGSPGGGESPPGGGGGGGSPGGGESPPGQGGSPGGGATPAPKDLSSHHLHQLLTDTFNSLNIKTFSVHLSKPSDFALNADSVSDQIIAGLTPISAPASSSSSSLRTFYSSLLASPNSTPRPAWSSQAPILSPSPSSSVSSEPPTATTSTASPFHSSPEKESLGDGSERSSDMVRGRALDTGERPPPLLPQQLTKHAAFQRRQNLASFRNRTRLQTRPSLALNSSPGKESSPSPTSPSSEDPSSPRRTLNGDGNRAAMVKVWTKRNQTTTRRQDGPGRHDNTNGGALRKPTHPRLRWSKLPTRPRNTETPSSPSSSGDPDPVSGPQPGPGGDGGRSSAEHSSAVAELSAGGPAGHTRLGLLQNRTRPGLLRRPPPPRRPNGDRDGITDQVQINQSGVRDSLPRISGQSEEQDHVHSSAHKTTTAEPADRGSTGENLGSGLVTRRVHRNWTEPGENIQSGSPDYPLRFETSQSGTGISNERLVPEEAGNALSEADSAGLAPGGSTRSALSTPDRVSLSGSEALGHGAPPPTPAPEQRTSLAGRTPAEQSPPPRRNPQSQQGRKRLQNQGSRPPVNAATDAAGAPRSRPGSGVPPPGSPRVPLREPLREPQREPARVPLREPLREPLRVPARVPAREPPRKPPGEPAREPPREPLKEPLGELLDYVGVRNQTADGFELVWATPEGKYSSFVVTRSEEDGHTAEEGSQEEEEEPPEEAGTHRGAGEENAVPETAAVLAPVGHGTGLTASDPLFSRELPGSARSFLFERLAPRTPFSVTLQGRGAGLPSRLHRLVISTGEPISVLVGSQDSSLSLSQLSPGSSYEVSVISVLGLDESDPIQDTVTTLPDPPSGLQVLNVTDSKALLLWRPATAAIDEYSIVYGTGEGSDLRVTVSGNVVEQQLTGLEESTTYSVTITSLLGHTHSSPATASFTTTPGEEEQEEQKQEKEEEEEEGPKDFQARQVTPRTALLSWEPPAATAVDRYRLTYQTEGEEPKEVTLNATTTNHKLRRLRAGSSYTATLWGERGGRPTPTLPTHFNTGPLRFPHPADCSEELLNGEGESGEVEVFLGGGPGVPLPVYCDMETDGGGWTVFQRRRDGSVDFFRGWKDYVKGFGELGGEFWLGLDNLHLLTSGAAMSLRVDLRVGEEAAYARYSTFQVAKKNYRLSVAGYSGTAGDSMSYHSGQLFSTRDRDPAPTPFFTRCAMSYRGGWWYRNCHQANLNGLYGSEERHQGVIWTAWKGKDFSVPFTEMKMRPSAFIPPTR